jgi:hypothetical protein
VRIVLFMLVTSLAACAAAPSGKLSAKEIQAVRSAEAFIARHGYTASGHPKDLPVENVESMDLLATPEDLVAWRRNTLEATAFGVTPCECDEDAFYVFFRRVNDAAGFRGVLVEKDEATQVVHSVLKLDGWPWKPVPPNKSLERTRER